jgi:hypothetical protein
VKKTGTNPMQSAHSAPRCTAMSKRSGKQCQAPAVRGKHVCRMHGAKAGAPAIVGPVNHRGRVGGGEENSD